MGEGLVGRVGDFNKRLTSIIENEALDLAAKNLAIGLLVTLFAPTLRGIPDRITALEAEVERLRDLLRKARPVIKGDADACRAFAAEGEVVPLEAIVAEIDRSLPPPPKDEQDR